MIAIVCPSIRDTSYVEKLHAAQTVETELIIVSDKSIGEARNIGVQKAKEKGCKQVVFWDDDDEYQPQYVEYMTKFLLDYDVVSFKTMGNVMFDDGTYYMTKPLLFFPGHCSAARVDKCEPFPHWNLCEDEEWSRRMMSKRAIQVEPKYMVYNRKTGNHAFSCEKIEFLMNFGPAMFNGKEVVASQEEIFQALERKFV